ncbi:uncharacterized protein STEHIDRAFT_126446 [Stereum hirsutum FP-91666 SS1]|uniref:Uncharacterized protein n=1 Tax=Stereum hirsutum (strain FP-91666) TaxID=721885 RepID=R7RXH5_STEHR|nr:uncharacterized protein STEHIDRAFT_126446 [Stereum hirsutum FP-91666 SS1]EIM79575.1 hypothetical protein STEHIDRAFT_126446 [Stereum hirsutum FP-91666 SS1]
MSDDDCSTPYDPHNMFNRNDGCRRTSEVRIYSLQELLLARSFRVGFQSQVHFYSVRFSTSHLIRVDNGTR